MDEIDLNLIKKLVANSRIPYRDLAETSNMSVSAIHKRINKLIEDGVISTFIARPSIIALKYLWIVIFGTSKARSLTEMSKEIGYHENVERIAIMSGKFVYVVGFLRDISELQDFSNYVSNTAQIIEPNVGILNVRYVTTPESLTTIDYKILKTLNRDARKSITDIAEDVGISAKTVRKRLDRMIENKLVTFSTQWAPVYKDCFITLFDINLNEGTDVQSTILYLNKKYSQNLVDCASYSNIPNMIIMETWTTNAQESQMILEKLHTEGFKNIIPHIRLSGEYFDCWIDQLLRTK